MKNYDSLTGSRDAFALLPVAALLFEFYRIVALIRNRGELATNSRFVKML